MEQVEKKIIKKPEIKTITIGDIHGKNIWNTINPLLYDKIIFIGDYVDSFHDKDNQIITNFKNIIQFKLDNFDKVVLLLGNHDLQYYFRYEDLRKFSCSGLRINIWSTLHHIYAQNKHLFSVAFQYKKYLWTHAGISKQLIQLTDKLPKDKLQWADNLNKLFKQADDSLFIVGKLRGGEYPVGSIFWADKQDTENSFISGLHQIVGHSKVKNIITNYNKSRTSSITYVDCLDYVLDLQTLLYLEDSNNFQKFYEKNIK